MNHGQAPQAPALSRPRRKVVADGNGSALASRFSGTVDLSPTARMTRFASISATGSGRCGLAQLPVRIPDSLHADIHPALGPITLGI